MRATGKAFVCVCLVLFYAGIVLLGMLLLATVQLRSSSGAGANYDTWRRSYQANSSIRAGLVLRLGSAQTRAEDDATKLSRDMTCLRFFDANHLPNHNRIDKQMAADVAAARQTHITPKNWDAGCVYAGYTQLSTDAADFDSRVRADATEITSIRNLISANDQQYSDLIKGHQDFLAFKDMEILSYYKPFVLVPYDLLVLVLAMMMGASGGVVRLLRDYGAPDHANPSHADYFIVPLIGAVVAMCGYVLAKAGLLALSSTPGETSLSPFMISFVGIISGLLAREVVDTIAYHGRKFLQSQGVDQSAVADRSAGVQSGPAPVGTRGGAIPAAGPLATPEHAG